MSAKFFLLNEGIGSLVFIVYSFSGGFCLQISEQRGGVLNG